MKIHQAQNRLSALGKKVGHFLLGQSGIQGLSLVTGFFVLHWMSLAQYAQFSVAFAFQSTLNVLVDLGFSGCIVALVGDRGSDPLVVGGYVRCARHYRSKTFIVLAVASLIVFPLVTLKQPWPLTVKGLLLSSVVTSVYFQGRILYSAPLLIHGRLKHYYRSGLASAVFRLATAALLHIFSLLNSWLYSWVSAMSIAISGFLYRKYSRDLLIEPQEAGREESVEMRTYLMPLWPGLIFSAFQGQIAIAVVTMFGRTGTIAEVAALGRIGQIFMVLTAVNTVLVEPMFARLSGRDVVNRYFVVLLLGSVAVAPLVIFSYLRPAPLIWLLGSKYSHLGPYVGIVMLTSAVNFIGSLAWTMNYARKWVTWSYTFAYICSVMAFQLGTVFLFDLSRVGHVLWWSMGSASVVLTVHVCVGLVRGASILRSDHQVA